MNLAIIDLGQVTKFNLKMQSFKRVLDLTWSKGGICSIGFQISKTLFFQMALFSENVQNVIQMALK